MHITNMLELIWMNIFILQRIEIQKKKYSEAVPLSFANSPLPSFHKEETDRQEQLNVKNF